MDELGLVVELKNEYAVVNIQRKSACGSCKACELGKSGLSEINVNVKNTLGATIGDRVMIQMQTPDVLKAAFTVYMIPLMALLIGVTGTYALQQKTGNHNEMTMMLVGVVMMLLSFVYVRFKDNKIKATQKFEPLMTEVVKAK